MKTFTTYDTIETRLAGATDDDGLTSTIRVTYSWEPSTETVTIDSLEVEVLAAGELVWVRADWLACLLTDSKVTMEHYAEEARAATAPQKEDFWDKADRLYEQNRDDRATGNL